MKKVKIRNTLLRDGTSSICTPIIGRTTNDLLQELDHIFSSANVPDLVEWRVDFFHEARNVEAVLQALSAIREKLGEMPLLFTFRAEEEGGERVGITLAEKRNLLEHVIKSEQIDILDIELFHEPSYIHTIRELTNMHNVKLIMSYHNFQKTPDRAEMLKKFALAEKYGADFAKLAVMPLRKQDVLTLLAVTEEANDIVDIPIITMSMGDIGSLSRMVGWMFGSVLTFGIRGKSSAPGQIPIDHLKEIMELTKLYIKNR